MGVAVARLFRYRRGDALAPKCHGRDSLADARATDRTPFSASLLALLAVRSIAMSTMRWSKIGAEERSIVVSSLNDQIDCDRPTNKPRQAGERAWRALGRR
jgi:hypothetical protein